MILGSHNSWSYLPPRQWWLRPLAFMARCQNNNIHTQYETHGVRCFDLRLHFTAKGQLTIAHGLLQYRYTRQQLLADLTYLNHKPDTYVRILHEVRTHRQHTPAARAQFQETCAILRLTFPNIHFWCGRNLADWQVDYPFPSPEPTCHEDYASVSPYKHLLGWHPWLYARTHNKKIHKTGTSLDILLIDYVNIK